jgi:hypothetical protein
LTPLAAPGRAAHLELRPNWTGKLAAVGARGLVRFAQWRGRKDAEAAMARPSEQAFRGFIQINLIRPN